MAAKLLDGSPGGTLSYLAGVIKLGRAALVFLVWVVQEWGLGVSQFPTGLKYQGIHSSHVQLGVATAGGLLQAC